MVLPNWLGGLGQSAPRNQKGDFENSDSFTTRLVTDNTLTEQFTAKTLIKNRKQTIGNPWPLTSAQKHLLTYNMPCPSPKSTGASSWLTTLPIQEHGFALKKGDFHNALALHYGWQPNHVYLELPLLWSMPYLALSSIVISKI